MYILLYASAIRLRFKEPDVERKFKIPFGDVGMCIIAGLGILALVFAIIVGFFPPSILQIKNPIFYVLFLVVGISVFISIPFIRILPDAES